MQSTPQNPAKSQLRVKSLSIYPLKAAAGHQLTSSVIQSTGLEHDRRFVLVDGSGRFVSQRSHPSLALLHLMMEPVLTLRHGKTEAALPLRSPTGSLRTVEVWGETVKAQDWGDAAARFLAQHFGSELRLCERLHEETRWVKAPYSADSAVPYYFADAFPLLIVSQESLELLNQKLIGQGQAAVTMDRFRPNIVIEGAEAHAEDAWTRLRIGTSIEIVLTKLCSRCPVVTVEPSTGIKGREPLASLALYRTIDGKIMFGKNAFLVSGAGSILRCGDQVEVLQTHRD